VQQHQGQQALRFRIGQQVEQQPAEADGFGGEVGAGHRVAGRGRVAFVEHQIDDVQHGLEALGQLGRRGHLIRNAGVADLSLGTHDPLRDGRGRREEGARDLFGGEAAHLAQREGHARVGRQGRMTAREDQSQAIVVHRGVVVAVHGGRLRCALQFVGERRERRLVARPAPYGVDGPEAAGRDEPRSRIGGHTLARPLLHGGGKGVVHGLLGAFEVAEQPDERGEHAAGVRAVDGLDRLPCGVRSSGHGCWLKSMTGRTSMVPVRASGILAATAMASFRSVASMR